MRESKLIPNAAFATGSAHAATMTASPATALSPTGNAGDAFARSFTDGATQSSSTAVKMLAPQRKTRKAMGETSPQARPPLNGYAYEWCRRVLRCSMVQYGAVNYGAVNYGAFWCSMVQCAM